MELYPPGQERDMWLEWFNAPRGLPLDDDGGIRLRMFLSGLRPTTHTAMEIVEHFQRARLGERRSLQWIANLRRR